MSENTSYCYHQIKHAFGLRLYTPLTCQYHEPETNSPCRALIQETSISNVFPHIQRLARQTQSDSAPRHTVRIHETHFLQELQQLAKHVLCLNHKTSLTLKNMSLQWLAAVARFPHLFDINPSLTLSLQHLHIQLKQIADSHNDGDAALRLYPLWSFDRAISALTLGHRRRLQGLFRNTFPILTLRGDPGQQDPSDGRQNSQARSRNTSTTSTPTPTPPIPDRSPLRNALRAGDNNSFANGNNPPPASLTEDDCEPGDDCPICASSWGGDPLVACNTCRQVFHEACIDTWAHHQRTQYFRQDATCPCCRSVWLDRAPDQEVIEDGDPDNGRGSDIGNPDDESDTEEDEPYFPASAIMFRDVDDLLDRGRHIINHLNIATVQVRAILSEPPPPQHTQLLESVSIIANHVLYWVTYATSNLTTLETTPDHSDIETLQKLLDLADRTITFIETVFDRLWPN